MPTRCREVEVIKTSLRGFAFCIAAAGLLLGEPAVAQEKLTVG